jgi:hypothetical protein
VLILEGNGILAPWVLFLAIKVGLEYQEPCIKSKDTKSQVTSGYHSQLEYVLWMLLMSYDNSKVHYVKRSGVETERRGEAVERKDERGRILSVRNCTRRCTQKGRAKLRLKIEKAQWRLLGRAILRSFSEGMTRQRREGNAYSGTGIQDDYCGVAAAEAVVFVPLNDRTNAQEEGEGDIKFYFLSFCALLLRSFEPVVQHWAWDCHDQTTALQQITRQHAQAQGTWKPRLYRMPLKQGCRAAATSHGKAAVLQMRVEVGVQAARWASETETLALKVPFRTSGTTG